MPNGILIFGQILTWFMTVYIWGNSIGLNRFVLDLNWHNGDQILALYFDLPKEKIVSHINGIHIMKNNG